MELLVKIVMIIVLLTELAICSENDQGILGKWKVSPTKTIVQNGNPIETQTYTSHLKAGNLDIPVSETTSSLFSKIKRTPDMAEIMKEIRNDFGEPIVQTIGKDYATHLSLMPEKGRMIYITLKARDESLLLISTSARRGSYQAIAPEIEDFHRKLERNFMQKSPLLFQLDLEIEK